MWLRRIAAFGFVALLLATKWGHLPYPDPRELQGAWEIVMIERHGAHDRSSVGFHMTFTGNELHFSAWPWTDLPAASEPESAALPVAPRNEAQNRAAMLS